MPEAWEVYDGRFIQEWVGGSAANALAKGSNIVPAGKVWTILCATHTPSVNETQTVWFSIYGRSTYDHVVTVPQSIALTVTMGMPMLTMGMELKLFPGETLFSHRAVATAGSTMNLYLRYIETDLPPFHYEDPQAKIQATKLRHGLSLLRSAASGGGGTPPGSAPPESGGGGRRGGREI